MKLIFAEEQFITLLALAGIKRLYLFSFEKKPNAQEIIQALAELYHSGLLKEEDGRFALTAPCKEMTEKMGKAEKVIQIDFAVGEPCQHLLYPDAHGGAVIMEIRPSYGKSVIRIWETDVNHYVFDLSKNERLPGNLTTDRKDAEFLEETALKETEEPDENGECLLTVKRTGVKTGKTENQIRVKSSLLFQWLEVEGENESYRHLYSEEEMADLLIKEIKGERL